MTFKLSDVADSKFTFSPPGQWDIPYPEPASPGPWLIETEFGYIDTSFSGTTRKRPSPKSFSYRRLPIRRPSPLRTEVPQTSETEMEEEVPEGPSRYLPYKFPRLSAPRDSLPLSWSRERNQDIARFYPHKPVLRYRAAILDEGTPGAQIRWIFPERHAPRDDAVVEIRVPCSRCDASRTIYEAREPLRGS